MVSSSDCQFAPLPNACEDGVPLLSDFAGICMPGFALEGLGMLGKHFCYETDAVACRFSHEHHPGVVVNGSVAERTPSSLQRVDAVVAGFSCQPFSRLGHQCGVHDARGRGSLVEHTLAYVRCHL